MNQILELFLKTGVDSDCYILMLASSPQPDPTTSFGSDDETSRGFEGDPRSNEPARGKIIKQQQIGIRSAKTCRAMSIEIISRHRYKAAYVVSLGEFVRQANPDNYEQLERLLRENNRRQEFSAPELSEIEAELATGKHPRFKSLTVETVDLKQFFANNRSDKVMVYWIRWKDGTVPGSFRLRLH